MDFSHFFLNIFIQGFFRSLDPQGFISSFQITLWFRQVFPSDSFRYSFGDYIKNMSRDFCLYSIRFFRNSFMVFFENSLRIYLGFAPRIPPEISPRVIQKYIQNFLQYFKDFIRSFSNDFAETFHWTFRKLIKRCSWKIL